MSNHPLDWALAEVGAPASGLTFPPIGWQITQEWGNGWALRNKSGLRVLIDCAQKDDGKWWVHVSYSRKDWTPNHADSCLVKWDFLGDRYAYAVFPPEEKYVNLHRHCLHLWALVDGADGRVLPEFSGIIEGLRSI